MGSSTNSPRVGECASQHDEETFERSAPNTVGASHVASQEADVPDGNRPQRQVLPRTLSTKQTDLPSQIKDKTTTEFSNNKPCIIRMQ